MRFQEILTGSLLAVVLSAAAGCGKPDQVRSTVNPSSQVQMNSVPSGGKPIPSGTSVGAVNPYLLGSYSYWSSGCLMPGGMVIPISQDSAAPTEYLWIQDKTVIREVYDSDSECDVVARYSIVGVDTQTLVLGNQQLTVTRGGLPDSANACASWMAAFGAGGNITLEYSFDYSGLSIYSAPTEPCEPDEKNSKTFQKI